MEVSCRVCENSINNRIHNLREMMFGTRETFDYLECGECGTLQIIEIPDLSLFYPSDYYSFDSVSEIAAYTNLKRRLITRFFRYYFVYIKNFTGNFRETEGWIKFNRRIPLRYFPPGLDFQSKILDFGCGAGQLLQDLHYFGFSNLTGADAFIKKDIFYPSGIKIYKRRLDEFEPFFDFIMLHHSFEHLPEPSETLAQIYRLLARDKFCLIRIPVVNFAWEKYGIHWVQLDPPRHLYLFTEKSFRHLAEKAGFKVERVIYDSEGFQFWGSEKYLRNISLFDNSKDALLKSVFTKKQMRKWQRQAKRLNARGKGDQACFYLRKK